MVQKRPFLGNTGITNEAITTMMTGLSSAFLIRLIESAEIRGVLTNEGGFHPSSIRGDSFRAGSITGHTIGCDRVG